jgi:L-rhamnose-H+ transport protein
MRDEGTCGGSGYAAVVLVAVLCGFLAPMLNYAFAFGQTVATEATALGNSPVRSAYAVWSVALLGGLVPNVAYSIFLRRRKGSWKSFGIYPRDIGWPILMAVALDGSPRPLRNEFCVFRLAWDFGRMGSLSNFHDYYSHLLRCVLGERKKAPRQAVVLLTLGMTALIAATGLLASGGAEQDTVEVRGYTPANKRREVCSRIIEAGAWAVGTRC